jgi:hypothetical protein
VHFIDDQQMAHQTSRAHMRMFCSRSFNENAQQRHCAVAQRDGFGAPK